MPRPPDVRPFEPTPWWYRDAACAGLDPSLFYHERGEPTEEAKEVCARCPVRHDCLDFALETGEKYGVWGGASERQRRKLRRKRVAAQLRRVRRDVDRLVLLRAAGHGDDDIAEITGYTIRHIRIALRPPVVLEPAVVIPPELEDPTEIAS